MKKIRKIVYRVIIGCTILFMIWAVVQNVSNNRFSVGGIKIFTVITGSMIPVYNIGDIIIVKEVIPEEITIGDDLVYKGEKGSYRNKTITHRVVNVKKEENGDYQIITKGVANTAQDPAINQRQVIGKVIGKIPIINWILKVITNIYFWIFMPVVLLIKRNIKKIKDMEIE